MTISENFSNHHFSLSNELYNEPYEQNDVKIDINLSDKHYNKVELEMTFEELDDLINFLQLSRKQLSRNKD